MKTPKPHLWMIFIFNIFAKPESKAEGVTSGPPENMVQAERPEKAETKLYNTLLSSYDKKFRPVLSAKDAVNVNISITLMYVLDVDEKHQSLTTVLWMLAEWFDPFLNWDQSQFPDINYLVIPANEIWTPDLLAMESLGNTVPIAAAFLGKSEGADVYPSGKVVFWFPVLLNSICPIRVETFPWDLQICPITIGMVLYFNQNYFNVPYSL